jgi:response regulator RpfG family c-di-GMP phosphodiesterase
VFFTSIIIYNISKKNSENKTLFYSEQLVAQTSKKLTKELRYVETIIEELSTRGSIQNISQLKGSLERLENFKYRNEISRDFTEKMRIINLGISSSITSINLVTGDSIIGVGQINYEKDQLINLNNLLKNSDNYKEYRILKDINGNTQIAIGVKVLNNKTGEYIGTILLTFKESYIKDTLEDLRMGEKAKIIVINNNGLVISKNTNDYASNIYFENLPMINKSKINKLKNKDIVLIDNNYYLVIVNSMEEYSWNIISFIPLTYIYKDSKILLTFIIAIGIITLILSLIFAIIISYSISNPINRLKNLMKRATDGDLDILMHDKGQDEIAQMAKAFNKMMISIDNLIKENKDTNKEIIVKLGEVIENRSSETGSHVYKVAHYSRLISLQMGFSEIEAENLKIASILHDIGKIAIPDKILLKPGKLTNEEFNLIKSHAEVGYEILKDSKKDILQLAAKIALEHHEKYDGTGYPRGIMSSELSIEGRIVALADVFDALSSERVYKKPWPMEDILNYLDSQRGKQFDSLVVDAFFEAYEKIIAIKDAYSK